MLALGASQAALISCGGVEEARTGTIPHQMRCRGKKKKSVERRQADGCPLDLGRLAVVCPSGRRLNYSTNVDKHFGKRMGAIDEPLFGKPRRPSSTAFQEKWATACACAPSNLATTAATGTDNGVDKPQGYALPSNLCRTLGGAWFLCSLETGMVEHLLSSVPSEVVAKYLSYAY